MHILIMENGPDLLLTNPTTDLNVYLSNPTWSDLIGALRGFTDIGASGETTITGPEIGVYQYSFVIDEHILTFYPGRATPNGWIATHLGTRYAYYVEVHEDGGGTITMVRDDLEQWTATDRPRPGAFFEELQTLSGSENPTLDETWSKAEWSFNNIDEGTIVAVVDINPDEDNEIEVILYPDAWGQAMQHFVMG